LGCSRGLNPGNLTPCFWVYSEVVRCNTGEEREGEGRERKRERERERTNMLAPSLSPSLLNSAVTFRVALPHVSGKCPHRDTHTPEVCFRPNLLGTSQSNQVDRQD
jgi:hypothetical protein